MRRIHGALIAPFVFFSFTGFLACGSGGGDSPSGSVPDGGSDAPGQPPTGDGGAGADADAAPLACAPLLEEDLPTSAIAWDGAPRTAADGFTTVYPAPDGTPPTRIRSAPGGSTWAVSVDAVYAWNGTTGRVHSVDVDTDLFAISPVSDDDVWAVGYESTVAHWNGSAWSVDKLSIASALSGVHARTADDVWAVGNFGVVGHFTGGSWSTTSLPGKPALSDVWAVSANDVWATELNGGVWHYDGTWTKVSADGAGSFHAAWASGPDDAWAAGEKGLLHGGAASLAPVTVPGAGGNGFVAVWGSSANDVWAADGMATFHSLNGAWTTVPGKTRWFTGRAANDVTALGDTHVRRFDGNAWSDVFQVGFPAINGAWKSPNGDLWFAGAKGTILRVRDGKLRRMTTTATGAATANLRAVWGSSDGDIWFGGDTPTLFHLTGNMVCPVPHGVAPRISALSGSGADDLWALTDTTAAHYDGKTWTSVPLEAQSIFASSKTDAWATGKSLFHWDGATWKPVDVGVPANPMNSFGVLGGSGPNDVWTMADVFLESDRLLHFDGTKWTSTQTNVSNAAAIAARSPTDVWLLDWNVTHLEGDAWVKKSKVPRRSVSAAIATDTALWVATKDGAILRLTR